MMGAIKSREKLVPLDWDDIETGAVAQQVREMYRDSRYLGADTP